MIFWPNAQVTEWIEEWSWDKVEGAEIDALNYIFSMLSTLDKEGVPLLVKSSGKFWRITVDVSDRKPTFRQQFIYGMLGGK